MCVDGKLKLLVVDDEVEITKLISMYFSKRGYVVLVANTGADAIKHVRENPDTNIILMDIMLPDFSGLELLEQFRSYMPDIVIIIVSGVNDLETVVRAMKLGADDYVVKPFRLGELEEKMEAALHKRAMFSTMSSEHGLSSEEAMNRLEKIKTSDAIITFTFDDIDELNAFTERVKNRNDVSIIDIKVGERYEISLKKG